MLGDWDVTGNAWGNAYFNLNGRPIAKYMGAAAYFMHTNALGSTTMVSDASGAVGEKKLYYPYGQEWVTAGTNLTSRFASLREQLIGGGQEISQSQTRDYPSRHYRWMSPDEFKGGPIDAVNASFGGPDATPPGPLPYADILNPQSLNKYQYAYNNPLRYNDPTGHGTSDELSDALLVATWTAAGGAIGAKFGGGTGAAGGTILEPGGGTLVGGLAGSALGGMVGSAVGYGLAKGLIFMKNASEKGGENEGTAQQSEEQLGSKGTKLPGSKTVSNLENGIRVDVENPQPGGRPGQIQVQRGSSSQGGDTLRFDPKTGQFTRASNARPSAQNRISNKELTKLTRSEGFKRAIRKALKYLGESE